MHPKPIRGPPKSWLKRQRAESRAKVAKRIKKHRYARFQFYDPYTRDRDFKFILGNSAFDLKRFLRRRMPKTGKLFILDSGAGNLGVSVDVKKTFGKRVFVTALDVASSAYDLSLQGLFGYGIQPRLQEVAERRSMLDENRVGAIENFSSQRKYNLIFDFGSGLLYSRHNARILEVYFNLLKPGGSILASALTSTTRDKIVLYFGEKSRFAKKHGYYFSVKQLARGWYDTVFEIRKLPVPKPK